MAQEESNSLFAGHVGNLVRIHEDGGGAAPHGGLSEFQRTEQTALDVKVWIDETRNHVLARDVKRFHRPRGCGRTLDTMDQPVFNAHIAHKAALLYHVNDRTASQYQVNAHRSTFPA